MSKELKEINKIKKTALEDWKDQKLNPLARMEAFGDYIEATTAERILNATK